MVLFYLYTRKAQRYSACSAAIVDMSMLICEQSRSTTTSHCVHRRKYHQKLPESRSTIEHVVVKLLQGKLHIKLHIKSKATSTRHRGVASMSLRKIV